MQWQRIARTKLTPILLGLASVLMLIMGGIYTWLLADLPPIHAVETRTVRPTTRILDRNGRLLYEVIDPNAGKQINLALDAIPPACVEATLATEDSRFWIHPGVDPIAITRAALQNLRSGGISSGASTLTQQLARSLLMDADERYTQSYRRKLREAWLAARLEIRYTKEELLALYLNQTYYGNFAFGIEAAAEVFFAKPAAQLSKAECALLAGLIQYPGGYNPLSAPDVAKARQQTVLRLMEESGYIDAVERAQIDAEPLRFRSKLFDIHAPHFVMYVQDLLAAELGPDRLRDGGLTVTTTLDFDLQTAVEASIRHRLDLLNCRMPGLCDELTDRTRRIDNAAAVVLDAKTGAILSMVGSPDYFDKAIQGNVNASLTPRQPGSAIKPFTYAAAMDPELSAARGHHPLTPATVIADLPTTFTITNADGETDAYEPLNYDRTYHGPVSVRTALAASYNIPAVKTLERIGVAALRNLATEAGITTFTGDYGLALTLGGGEVRLLDLTAAFGILDDGEAVAPRAILGVEEPGLMISNPTLSGNTENAAAQSSIFNLRIPVNPENPIITPATAYLITDILADPVARMPAFGQGSVLELPFPAAVKTGTTTDWRDNWSVGYSTDRIVGVWVGNADNAPMVGVSGVDGAGPIWHDAMLAAHTETPSAFPRPDGISDVVICSPSGLLPSEACPRTRREQFIAGTEPQRVDNQFQRLRVDQATGMLAVASIPEARVTERVYWQLGPEYREWMISQGIPIAPPLPASAEDGIKQLTNQLQPELTLTTPTDLAEYQLHPGLPSENQRIEVRGYTTGGQPWTSLRLMVDGEAIAHDEGSTDLDGWWVLTPGQHAFWIEGESGDDAPTVRSDVVRLAVYAVDTFEENVLNNN